MAGEWIDPLTGQLRSIHDKPEGICPRCHARSLEPICDPCVEMLEREMEAISFMTGSVVK
jgi:hypothetical protein